MKLSINSFNYLEFINTVETKKRSSSNDDSESGSRNFTGTDSYKEAKDYAINGWDAGIKMLQSEDLIEISGSVNLKSDVVGSFVNIGNYLNGTPDTMYSFTEEVERNKDDLTIFVNLGYSAGIEVKQAMNYCKNLIKEINKLNTLNNLRIIGFFINDQEDNVREVTMVEIKSLNERFVLNSLAFAFHPSFFRRIWFRHIESKSYMDDGYGRPCDANQDLKGVKSFCKQSNINSYWVYPSLQNNGESWEEEQIQKIQL